MQLAGTVALVTGGGSGLGRSTVEALVQRGARVALLDIDEGHAHDAAAACGALALPGDVRNATEVADALDAIQERLGQLRLAVCCHGVLVRGRTLSRNGPASLEDFERTVAINLVGTFNVLRLAAGAIAAAEELEDGERGAVVLTASIAAYEGQIGQTAYAASKAGVVGLTLPAARDLGGLGIRVASIAPGIFETPMIGALEDEAKQAMTSAIPFPRRFGRPEEFARLVCDIAENPAVNGVTIRLDGGLRLAPR